MPTAPSSERLDVFLKDYLTVAQEVADRIAAKANQYNAEAGLPNEEVALLKDTGLLLLPVPREYGGAGATWPQLYQVVKLLAGASGSICQLYANHIGLVNAGAALGRPGQAE